MKRNQQNARNAPRAIELTTFHSRLFDVRIKYAQRPKVVSVKKKISASKNLGSSLSSIDSYHQNYFIVSHFNGKKSLFYG
jgi:hypothetical protein